MTVFQYCNYIYTWQSRIEIEYYSVAYFKHTTKFERWTSAKGGAHTRFIDTSDIYVFTHCVWAPLLAEAEYYSALNLVMRLKYATE